MYGNACGYEKWDVRLHRGAKQRNVEPYNKTADCNTLSARTAILQRAISVSYMIKCDIAERVLNRAHSLLQFLRCLTFSFSACPKKIKRIVRMPDFSLLRPGRLV